MSNWLAHVKATMKKLPKGTLLKDVLKEAKKTYKKGESVVKYAVTGKKSSRKGRKSHKKSAKKAKKSRKSRKSAKKSRKSRRR